MSNQGITQNKITKKATKKQLIGLVNDLTSRYLGFTTTVSGLSSCTKDDLQDKCVKLNKAIAWKQYAKKQLVLLKAEFGEQAVLYVHISGTKSITMDKYCFALKMAESYWFNQTTSQAYERSLKYA